MSQDKMREEFETAIALEAGEPVLSVYLSRRNDTYSTSTLHFAWWAWKASREAVAVELPSASAYEGLTEHLGSVIELSYEAPEHDPVGLAPLPAVRAAIEAAGLKVKP